MPLSCDCYGGCWGDHSEGWPAITGRDREILNQAYRACWEQFGFSRGTFVLVGTELRLETENQKALIEEFLRIRSAGI
jgi:hypothetical protein